MTTVIRMQLWVQDHKPVLLALLMTAAIMGLAADCNEGGWSQEGGDVTWRK